MALSYVLGRVGQGKSYCLFENIRRDLELAGGYNILLLVPEQFTLQTERDLIRHLGGSGIIGVEVLSLSSLGERVLRETGGSRHPILDEAGKRMLLRRVVSEHYAELRIYGPVCRQNGFIKQLSDFISQVKQYQVSWELLRSVTENLASDSLLEARLSDLLLLSQAFEAKLQGCYLDLEDRRDLFMSSIIKSEMLRNAHIYIDGFNTVSEQNRMILEQIIVQSEECMISLCLPEPKGVRDQRIFKRVKQTWQALHSFARAHNIEERYIRCGDATVEQNRSQEIRHLEGEIYAWPWRRWQRPVQSIRLLPAQSRLSEMEAMAEEISCLLRDEGYRLQDIAVITNDIAQYGPVIRRVLHDHGIPVFMDQKRDIMLNPLVNILLTLLDLFNHNWPHRELFIYLKSGLIDIAPGELAKLENYVLAHGVKGQQWARPFFRGAEAERDAMEVLRRRVMEALLILQGRLSQCSRVRDYSQVIFEFLQQQGWAENLELLTRAMEQELYFDYAAENRQMWNTVLDCLDQLVTLMGDMEISLREYRELLEAGFSSYELGAIPTMIDQVLIGSISRSMSHNVRAMFILGLNDGIIPSVSSSNGLFSRADERLLQECELTIGPDHHSREAEEQFLISQTMGKASERLYLSYSLSDLDGSALRPSILVDRIRMLFPGLEPAVDPTIKPADLCHINGPGSTYPGLIRQLKTATEGNQMPGLWTAVVEWYRGQDNWQGALQRTKQGLSYCHRDEKLKQPVLMNLSDSRSHFSISALERFARCPFSYYVHYTLRARERRLYDLQPQQTGEIFHQFMQAYSQAVEQCGLAWESIDAERGEAMAEQVLEPILLNYGEGMLSSNRRFNMMGHRIGRICRRAARTMTAQIQRGDFRPIGIEMNFGRQGEMEALQLEMEDGRIVSIEGRIDRVDGLITEEGWYIRIVDYKSSDQKLPLSGWYHGLNLQLPVYLWAALNGLTHTGKDQVKPAGLLYFTMEDPLIESNHKDLAALEAEKFAQLKLRGILLDDPTVIGRMDRELGPNEGSAILPVRMKVNSELYSESTMSAEEIELILKRAQLMIRMMIDRILHGDADIRPARHGQQEACTYCEYGTVCHFDRGLPGYDWQRLPQLKRSEFLHLIKEEERDAMDS